MFEQRGYIDTRVSDIARAAGVAHGTFYLHFATKHDAFIGVASDVRDELLTAQMQPRVDAVTYRDAIRQAMQNYLTAYRPSALMIAMIEQVAISDAEIRATLLEIRHAVAGNTQRSLDSMQRRGVARFEGSSELLSLAISGMVQGLCFLCYVLGEEIGEGLLLETLTDAYLNAARIDGVTPLGRAATFEDLGALAANARRQD